MIPVERTPSSVRIGGIGGQGNIKMGLILAKTLTLDKKWVVQTQHYGAQVRGGVAYSDVLFSNDPIDFPKAYQFDMLYMMDQKPLDSFANLLKPNGVLICDSTFVKKVPLSIRRITRKMVLIPITEQCTEKFGTPVVSNVVGLGLLQKTTGIVNPESLKAVVSEEVPAKFLDLNMEALAFGISLCSKSYALRDEKTYQKILFE